MSLEALRRASDENVVAAFELVAPYAGLGGERRSFGAAGAIFSGIDHPFYNAAFALDPRVTIEDIDAAIAWIRARGQEPCIQVRVDLRNRFDAHLAARGFTADPRVTPAMALQPIPSVVPDPPSDVAIEVFGGGRTRTRSDRRRLDDWLAVFGNSALFRRLIPLEALSNPNLLFAVGHDAEGPVCCAIAARSASALGIYAVGTQERARRRGYGTAITWAAIAAGRDAWGMTTAVLQSSEMGLGVYERMGFETVTGYVEFNTPKREAPSAG